MFWTTLVFCNLVSGILCVVLARKHGGSALHWFLLAIPLGVLALFLQLYLHERSQSSEEKGPQPRD